MMNRRANNNNNNSILRQDSFILNGIL